MIVTQDVPGGFTCDRCGELLPFTQLTHDEDVWGSVICSACVQSWKQERGAHITSIETATHHEPEQERRVVHQKPVLRDGRVELTAVLRHWGQQWRACMSAFLAYAHDRSGSNNTVRTYSFTLAHFFSDGRDPTSYTKKDVEAFLTHVISRRHQAGETPSVATQSNRLGIVSSFFKFASGFWVDGPDGEPGPLFQKALPTLGIRRGARSQKFRVFTEADLRAFFAAIDASATSEKPNTLIRAKRDRALFSLLFFTSRRRSEILNLRWKDIEETTYPDGKGGLRPSWRFSFAGKGYSRIQDFQEMPASCVHAVFDFLEASGRLSTMESEQPIFIALAPDTGGGVQLDDSRPMSGSSVWSIFKYYCACAGLGTKYSVHSLRHASALQRFRAGEDVLSIQRALRHKSGATTFHYLQGLQGSDDPGSALLEKRFSDLMSQGGANT